MIDTSKPLWQLTVGEFLELQKSAEPEPVIVPEEKYFTPKEAREYLRSKNMKISESTLYRWRKFRILNAGKKGGLLSYKKSDLDNFLNNPENQKLCSD